MSESRSGRVDIVPQGEFHFEVRFFEGEKNKRYRSWSLPLAAAEAITRWWLTLPYSKEPGWRGDSRESWLLSHLRRKGRLSLPNCEATMTFPIEN